MPLEAVDLAEAAHLPQPDAVVRPAGEDSLAIGGESHAPDLFAVAFELADLLADEDRRWFLEDAVGINDAGQIIANGSDGGPPRALLLTPLDDGGGPGPNPNPIPLPAAAWAAIAALPAWWAARAALTRPEVRMTTRVYPSRGYPSHGLRVCLAVCALASTSLAGPVLYRAADLGTLGGFFAEPRAINERGQVVGRAELRSYDQHAFLWDADTMRDLGVPSGFSYSEANDINDAGVIVGTARGTNVSAGFVYQAGTMRRLDDLASPGSGLRLTEASAVNERGQVLAQARDAGDNPRAAILDLATGQVRDLGTLGGEWASPRDFNDAGQVVGASAAPDGTEHAFLYDPATGMRDLGAPTGPFATGRSRGEAVNDAGLVAGTYDVEDLTTFSVGAVFQNGSIRPIGIGDTASIGDINDAGQIVGWFSLYGGEFGAFMYDGVTAYDLDELLVPGTNWLISGAGGINNGGVIAATGFDPETGWETGLLLTPVDAGPGPSPIPLPAAAWAALGSLPLVWAARRTPTPRRRG
jgi:probable HAF family extracellular repeat protein